MARTTRQVCRLFASGWRGYGHPMSESTIPASEAAEAVPHADPYAIFAQWFAEARKHEPGDPEAVALASATPGAAPSVRMVLMKDFGPELGTDGVGGFVFYTNGHSRKGAELLANPQAAMLFHWKSLRRQVRIEGRVAPVADAVADAYFASRSRDSQLGALASDQSRPLPSRGAFLARAAKEAARHLGRPVPRPPHWTGFCLTPLAIEFWMDRRFRLHDRRRFERTPAGWTSTLLYP